MPELRELVINTGPILAIVAALGNLDVLQMYDTVWVPFEVSEEILLGGPDGFAVTEFEAAGWLRRKAKPLDVAPMLSNSLDLGEAAVVQLALDNRIRTVCIDEAVGRRVARLNGLEVTGSLGILMRAHRRGYGFPMQEAIDRMRAHGVWLSDRVVDTVLEQVRS